ncbi:OmpA family protein [Verrucomicrobiaceae bacterium N1E253]|uniref:OmpA family protein n=1 Tax=Oceaniferula marina TaxID=2748318 RepID=A0A851GIE1_9BACT|nr:OmpA family protein [Oceaniferula marina]NWK54897.1 OmpA family protein [Oceaniferula marina]
MPQSRPQTPVLIFFAIAVVAIIAVVVLLYRLNSSDAESQSDSTQASTEEKDPMSMTVNGKHVDDTETNYRGTPEELVGYISEIVIKANETGDLTPFIDLIGEKNLTPKQITRLRSLAGESRLQLNQEQPFSPVDDSRNDWALNLADEERILLKLAKNPQGSWQVDGIALPLKKQMADPPKAAGKDDTDPQPKTPEPNPEMELATATVQAFLNAILQLDPTEASKHVDASQVSYATLAGLCILFEEGKYQLRQEKAIRNMFLSNNAAGWMIRIQPPNEEKSAMFALSSKRQSQEEPWKVTEINLDKLLSDYASRLSGGDIHYVPLIKNLRGGDSIVLFFKLDSNELTRRTKRQLKIVAKLLKASADKKLTISGHTDALGSDSYNLKLSRKRAEAVVQFLTEVGVPAQQMQITSHGKSQPRQPNTTDDGRRANRRAEIILDF